MLYSIICPNFIAWLHFRVILGNICIVIVCEPNRDAVFFTWPKSRDKIRNVLQTRRVFKIKLKHFSSFLKSFHWSKYNNFLEGEGPILQAWILAADMRQSPAKNRLVSDKDCFATDTVVRRELKKKLFISYQRLKTQKHSISIGIYCFGFFMNILIDNLLLQFFYIPNRTLSLSKKIL